MDALASSQAEPASAPSCQTTCVNLRQAARPVRDNRTTCGTHLGSLLALHACRPAREGPAIGGKHHPGFGSHPPFRRKVKAHARTLVAATEPRR